MTLLQNTLAGVTSGAALTAANSGGTSGDAFTGVDLTGTGVSATVNTSADITAVSDRGAIFNANSRANASVAAYWDTAAVSTSYQRAYFKSPTANPNAIPRLSTGATSGNTRVWELRYLTSGLIALVDSTSGATIIQTTAALAFSTIYRIEWKVGLTNAACDLRVYAGEATTGALATTRFSANAITGTNTSWSRIRYGSMTGGTGYNQPVTMAGLGYSDGDWLGPATAAPSGPTLTVWNGASEVTATLTVWDGTSEAPVSSLAIA